MRLLTKHCFVVLVVLPLAGCSVSNSISSPFESSSGSISSSSQSRRDVYQRDVRDYTEAYVRSSSDLEQFKSGLAGIAQKHGISNWESDSATYLGIGAGLRKARVSTAQLDVYKTNLSGGDPGKANNIQRGYDQQD